MKLTGWSPKRTSNDESMPSTDDYRLHDILSRACGSTAQSSESASALELGKYNHFRETYVRCLRMRLHAIDVYDRWSMITDGYERCLQGRLKWMPSHDYAEIRPTVNEMHGQYGSGDMEVSWSIGRFLVSLFSSSLLWILAWYKWRRHGFYHLPLEVEFPPGPDPPKGCPVQYWSVVGLIGSSEYVRRTVVWLVPSFPFLRRVAAAQGVWC